MTVYEKIKSMNIDELVKWFAQFSEAYDDTPWLNWFDDYYCEKCDPEIRYINGREYCFGWCELNDGCKYFQEFDDILDNEQMIRMWLETEAE